MSNRYATGFGIGFCFRSIKQRKWFLDMFNGKMESLIKRISLYPGRDVVDIMGDNLGITGGAAIRDLASAIRLRNVRTEGPNDQGEWIEECYASVVRLTTSGKIINVLLVDNQWYMSEAFMHLDEYRFASRCLSYRAERYPDPEEELKDSLIKALISSGMNDNFLKAIHNELPNIDAEGIWTVADFEMACDD